MSREAFEEFCKGQGLHVHKDLEGYYKSQQTDAAWDFWQAAEAAAVRRCAGICKAEAMTECTSPLSGAAYNLAVADCQNAIRREFPQHFEE